MYNFFDNGDVPMYKFSKLAPMLGREWFDGVALKTDEIKRFMAVADKCLGKKKKSEVKKKVKDTKTMKQKVKKTVADVKVEVEEIVEVEMTQKDKLDAVVEEQHTIQKKITNTVNKKELRRP